jgi:hypothetical protein
MSTVLAWLQAQSHLRAHLRSAARSPPLTAHASHALFKHSCAHVCSIAVALGEKAVCDQLLFQTRFPGHARHPLFPADELLTVSQKAILCF